MLDLIQQESSQTVGSNEPTGSTNTNQPASPTITRYLHDHPKMKLLVFLMIFTSVCSVLTVVAPILIEKKIE